MAACMPPRKMKRVLVFGASGYIGRHLTPALAKAGFEVRAAARGRSALEAEGWTGVEIVEADALDPSSLSRALGGVDTAFYLVHSMAAGDVFPVLDRQAAEHFAAAAAEAGLRRIVYLGGLAPPDPDTPHLASRQETGDVLRHGSVPVTELRAGIVVGPGSVAFEVMRDLVAHLPLILTPRWVRSKSPPIALEDLIADLIALPNIDAAAGGVFEAGGPQSLTYEQMMKKLASMLGCPARTIIPVALLTPRLSSYWLRFVSAVPANVAQALISGLKYDLDADDRPLRALVPRQPMTFEASVSRVFEIERGIVATDRWRVGAFALRGGRHDVSFYCKSLRRSACGAAKPGDVWRVLSEIGTKRRGYFSLDGLWSLRSWLDRRLGGRSASRRGDNPALAVGAAFDFWEVIAVTPGRRLTLLSHLIAPGAGGIEFEIEETAQGGASLAASIHWHPAGFIGLIYWYALWPVHAFVLGRMVIAVLRGARAMQALTSKR